MDSVTSPMNECMEISVRKMSHPTHQSNKEFGNNLKKKKSIHHEQLLGLETLENQQLK